MSRETRVEYQGRQIEGTSMDFESVKELWNEYRLENGATVRVKIVPVEIVLTGENNPVGDPLVVVKSSILVHYEPTSSTPAQA